MTARFFRENYLGVGLDQRSDTSLIDLEVVVSRLDSEILSKGLAETPSRSVNTVGDQEMIASLQIGQQRHGHRDKTYRNDLASRSAIDARDHIIELMTRGIYQRAVT